MQNPPVMQNEFSARQNNFYSLLLLDLISMILYKHDVIFFLKKNHPQEPTENQQEVQNGKSHRKSFVWALLLL